jgi:glutathionylspermidine synthase
MLTLKKKALAIFSLLTAIVALSPLFRLPLVALIGIILGMLVILVLWSWRDISTFRMVPLQKVERFAAKHDRYVFVYGSLLVRDSLLRTIARSPSEMECIPAYLFGYKTKWGALSKRNELLDKDSRSIQDGSVWASLTAVKGHSTDRVPGAVIGVTNLGYVALRNRERHYILKDVTRSVETLGNNSELPGDRIMAFLPKAEPEDLPTSAIRYIRREYFNAISTVLKKLGFKGLHVPPGFELRTAYLVSEQVEKILRSKYGESVLLEIHKAVSDDFSIAKETRSVAYSLSPLVLPRLVYDQAAMVSEAAVSISTKALEVLNRNPSLVLWAKYRDKDIEFLRHSAQCGELTPKIARVDMAIAGNRLLVFELNSDSPGGMRHLDILSAKQSGVFQNHKRLHWINGQSYDTSEETVRALERSCAAKRDLKRAIILEYRPKDWPTYPEMVFFKDMLDGRGIKTEIVDLAKHSLETRDGSLFLSNGSLPIDLVYKRILWKDLLKSHVNAEQALTEAFNNNYSCIVNSLGARMSGNKMVMALIKAPEFVRWIGEIGDELTSEELSLIKNNIPESFIWGDTPSHPKWTQDKYIKRKIVDEPYLFVLKSYHGYGGYEVVVGCEKERPQSVFEDLWNEGYIAQEYVPHGRALIPIYDNGKIKWEYHYYIVGAYVIDGKCVAIEAKTSNVLPINMANKAVRTAVFPTI